MENNTKDVRETLTTYRTRADMLVRTALEVDDNMPLYGMLRYFMGYEDEYFQPVKEIVGKRVRSSLLLLIADMFGGAKSADDLAIAVELFHNFTLIHDDIEDNDEMRRGRPTVWKVWGVDHGINSGDGQAFLTTKHLLHAAQTGEAGACAAEELNTYFLQVIEGQYLDFELTKKSITDIAVTREAYLEMIRKKTSVLIGTAVAAGGVAAGCTKEVRDALFTYGESFGMAYQIADDMSSLWGDTEKTGKRAQGDVYERKKTYPILHARDHANGARLVELYESDKELTKDGVTDVLEVLEQTDACEATRELGDGYVQNAKDAVTVLPIDVPSKEVLVGLVDTLVRFSPDNHASD